MISKSMKKGIIYSSLFVELLALLILLSILISGVMFIYGLGVSPNNALENVNITYGNLTYYHGNFQFLYYLNLDNRGIYPIQQTSIKYSIRLNNTLISTGYVGLPPILGHFNYPLKFSVNGTKIMNSLTGGGYYYVFHPIPVLINLFISASYAVDLIHLSLNLMHNLTIPSPVIYYSMGKPNTTLNSGYLNIDIPFTVDTSTYLSGNALLNLTLLKNRSQIFSKLYSVPLGYNYSSTIDISIPESEVGNSANMQYITSDISLFILGKWIPMEVHI